jgi:hypothetical protein
MCSDLVLEYDRHIGEKLIMLIIGMDHVIFQPLHSMLGEHMIFNIVIMGRGRPSQHFSYDLVLGVDLLLLIECNTKMALQTNHL